MRLRVFAAFTVIIAIGGGSEMAGATTTPAPACVKAQCCHATSCSTTAPDCTAAICTRECRAGTMDCGAGWCSYGADGECKAFWANETGTATPAPATCSGGSTDNLACVPAQCCHPTTCTTQANAPDCTAASCTEECRGGTMDCGAGACRCGPSGCFVAWTTSAAPSTSAVPIPPPSPGTCAAAPECVPAQCCHPTSCTTQANAPDCTAVSCSAVCESGTMDCGHGTCACGAGGCYVIWQGAVPSSTAASPPPPPPASGGTCSRDAQCVPATCCGSTECVSAIDAPDCSTVLCPAVCRVDWIGCGFASCGCSSAGQCRVVWNSTHAPSTLRGAATGGGGGSTTLALAVVLVILGTAAL